MMMATLMSMHMGSVSADGHINNLGCVTGEVDYSVDLFPAKVSPEHSAHWTITYHNTYKIITNTMVGPTSYLLYQCGTEPPVNATVDHHMVIPVPLQDGIVLTSTVYIPHVELLGKRTDITYVGNTQYISSPCLINLLDDDKITVIPGMYDADYDEDNLKKHLAEFPDAVVIANSWTNPDTENHLIVSETAETSSNKAVFEWHKVYAALYNLEHLGNDIAEQTAARYDCGANNAAIVSADNAPKKVLWASWLDYGDIKAWTLGSCPNYYCEFAEHCSSEFMQPTEEQKGSVDCFGSACMTDEEFMIFAKDADVWVFPADDWNVIYKSKKDMLDQFGSVISESVYDTYGTGKNTWFEQRMAEYDVVLQDFCTVVGNTISPDFHTRQYFRNVFKEPVGSLPVCTDVEAPLVTQHTQCTLLDEATYGKDTTETTVKDTIVKDTIVKDIVKNATDAKDEITSPASIMTKNVVMTVVSALLVSSLW